MAFKPTDTLSKKRKPKPPPAPGSRGAPPPSSAKGNRGPQSASKTGRAGSGGGSGGRGIGGGRGSRHSGGGGGRGGGGGSSSSSSSGGGGGAAAAAVGDEGEGSSADGGAATVMKLGDLGLGRYFSSKKDVTHSTVGTPYYMSPECIQGGGYDFKSDIWSLGCLLYELATLRSPFYSAGLNFYMLGKRIMKRQFEPLGAVSPDLAPEIQELRPGGGRDAA